LFFITFSILSILGTEPEQFVCGVQEVKKEFFRVKKEFFRVKKEFFRVKKEFVFYLFFVYKKRCIFHSFLKFVLG